MTKIKLYEPQIAAFRAINAHYEAGGQFPAVQLPTGMGKALLGLYAAVHLNGYAADMFNGAGRYIGDRPGRVAYFAHTEELLQQPYDSLFDLAPHLMTSSGIKRVDGRRIAGMVKGSRDQVDSHFVFMSMQTAGVDGRLERVLEHGAFDFVVVDEFHHAAAPTYREHIVPMIREANPDVKWLGMTATLGRTDGLSLGMENNLSDGLVYQMSIFNAIQNGYLKGIKADTYEVDVDLTKAIIRDKSGSHVNERISANILKYSNWVELVVKAWLDRAPDRQTIAFMPSVDMCRELAEYLNKMGIKAASVDSEMIITPEGVTTGGSGSAKYDRARAAAIQAYRDGEYRVLSGFNALLEGFDAPKTSCILWARPTLSPYLLTQALGRGFRRPDGYKQMIRDEDNLILVNYDNERFRYANKDLWFHPDCYIIDFTTVNTPLLVANDLIGVPAIELPTLEEIEEKQTDPETIDIFDVQAIGSKFDSIVNGDAAEALRHFKRNFFTMTDKAWTYFPHGNTMSVYLGYGHGLFIVPPNPEMYTKAGRVLRIINALTALAGPHDEFEAQAFAYKKSGEKFNSFSLYHLTPAFKTVKSPNPKHKDYDQPNWFGKVPVTHCGRFRSFQEVWEKAFILTQTYASDGAFTSRRDSWRRGDASAAQVDLIIRPNKMVNRIVTKANAFVFDPLVAGIDGAEDRQKAKDALIKTHGVLLPDAGYLEGLNKGRVSDMISHLLMFSHVLRAESGPRIAALLIAEQRWSKLWKGMKPSDQ